MRICGVVVGFLLVASVARADELQSVGDKVAATADTGEAWNVDVPKLAALLGAPSLVKDDRIEWAFMDNEMCAHVVITADADGFLKSYNTTEGVLDSEDGPACKKLLAKKVKLPAKLRSPKPLDADAQATAIVEQWGAAKLTEIFNGAHPDLRDSLGSADVFAQFKRLFEKRAGKFVKLGTPFEHAFKNYGWMVSAPVSYEKGTLQIAMTFEPYKGKPALTNFNVKLPKNLQAQPDPKDAARAARADLDLLLAAKTAAIYDHMEWDLAKKAPPATLEPILANVLGKLGKIKSVKQTDQSTCDGHQCFTYEVTSAGGKSNATIELSFNVAEWQMVAFNVEPPP
jgi:hypothetical protein